MSLDDRLRALTEQLPSLTRALTSLESRLGERLEHQLRARGWTADELEELKDAARAAVQQTLDRYAAGQHYAVAVRMRGMPPLRTHRLAWNDAIDLRNQVIHDPEPLTLGSVTIVDLRTGDES